MGESEAYNMLRRLPNSNITSKSGLQLDEVHQFHEHINKCRCCFNEFEKENRKVKISEWHREVYRSVIKVELRMDSNLSVHLCENCNSKLKNLSEFIQAVKRMADRCDEYECISNDEIISYDDIIEQNNDGLEVMENIEIEKELFSTHQTELTSTYCEIDMGLISKVNLKDCSVNLKRLSENSSRKYVAEFKRFFKQKSNMVESLLYCDLCRYQSTKKTYMKKHIINMHKEMELFFSCDLCRYQTTKRQSIHIHMKRMHSFKESKCMRCEKICPNETRLRDHMKSKHSKILKSVEETALLTSTSTSKNIFICDFCHYWTDTKLTLRRHISRDHQKEKISCHICKNKYASSKTFKMHLREHHSEKPKFSCEICGADFCLYKSLSCHVEKCHLMEKKKIISSCDICGMDFFMKSVLEDHMKSIHGHPFKCFYRNCSRSFPRKDARNSHYVTVHHRDQKEIKRLKLQEENFRPFKCPFNACGLSFKLKRSMRRHFKIHQKSAEKFRQELKKKLNYEKRTKPWIWKKSSWIKQIFICDICDYKTPIKTNMKTHMNSRHKFEVSECHICKKGYFNAERLKTHLRSHIEKEKYECSLCAWKFRTYNILCSHIKRHHAMEKSQITCQCDFCGAEYLSKMHLENHLKKIHSGPYGCFIKECKSRFTCQSTRKNHYLLLHNCDQNQMELLRLQQAEEAGMRPYKCLDEACGKTFKTTSSMNHHNFQVHMKKDLKAELSSEKSKFMCLLCDRKVKAYVTLCRHIEKRHFKDKSKTTFVCDVCGKYYFIKLRLEFHMRFEHFGSFKCFDKSCRKSFTQNNSRRTHFFQFHNNDRKVYKQKEQEEGATKPYKCPHG